MSKQWQYKKSAKTKSVLALLYVVLLNIIQQQES